MANGTALVVWNRAIWGSCLGKLVGLVVAAALINTKVSTNSSGWVSLSSRYSKTTTIGRALLGRNKARLR